MRLDKCLGKKLGFVTLATEPPALTRDLKSAGYPLDRRDRGGITRRPTRAGSRARRQRMWLTIAPTLPAIRAARSSAKATAWADGARTLRDQSAALLVGAGAVQPSRRERRDAHGGIIPHIEA